MEATCRVRVFRFVSGLVGCIDVLPTKMAIPSYLLGGSSLVC